jgi:phage terminase small subunit
MEIAEDPEAKREYVRVVQLLGEKLDERDRSLLCEYALIHAEIQELRVAVDLEGRVLVGPKGGSYLNPTVNLLISRQGHLAQLRRDLYFTPKSRIEKQTKGGRGRGGVRASVAQDDGHED